MSEIREGETPLIAACRLLGSHAALARAIGVSGQAIDYLIRRNTRIPAERVIPIEVATNGLITRYEMRPDIYPVDP